MSQPPAFEVLKLPAEFKAVLQHEMQSLTDLGKFYKSLEALATQVNALRQDQGELGPDEMAEKRRSGIVSLCQAAQTFQDIKSGTFVSCPGLYLPTKKFNDALNRYLHGQCVSSWKHSLTHPLVVVSKIIGWAWEDKTFQKEDKTVLETALGRVADAKLLATGFQDGQVKAHVHLATNFVEAMVHLAESVLDGSRSQAVSVRCLHDVLIALELVAKDSEVSMNTQIAKEKLECVAVKIFEHLYVDMPSSGPESTEVKLEMVGYFLETVIASMNEVVGKLSTDLRGKIDKCVHEIQAHKPFPEYSPEQEKEFVDSMKPKHKSLTASIDSLETQLKELEENCGHLGVETVAFHPDFTEVKALVKEALTVCCTHTAARILLSKAAANASGNLLSSLQATLQFASANKIELHQGILQKLHACRDKLAAASSSKQKAAAKS